MNELHSSGIKGTKITKEITEMLSKKGGFEANRLDGSYTANAVIQLSTLS